MLSRTDGAMAVSSDVEEPIRAEVFGVERLEQHAASLAVAVRITERPNRGRDLLPRVRDNGRALLDAYHNVVEAVAAKREITLAEEWFLDNFHVVDQQLREIRDHLPRGYYRRLPKIAAGHLVGYPRVYALAWAYVAHTDSRLRDIRSGVELGTGRSNTTPRQDPRGRALRRRRSDGTAGGGAE